MGFLLHLAYQLVAGAQHFLVQRGEQAEQLAGGEWGAVCHAQQVQQRLHAFAGAGQGLVAGAEGLFDVLVERRQPFHQQAQGGGAVVGEWVLQLGDDLVQLHQRRHGGGEVVWLAGIGTLVGCGRIGRGKRGDVGHMFSSMTG